MNITVYCGSNPGNDPEYQKAASDLGLWIAKNGHQMIYGGGNIGLMGIIADTVLANGGAVTGVIPEFLLHHEKGHQGLHRLEIVETMAERKTRMISYADTFIAMPGGVGTLEEISEVLTLKHLGRTQKRAFFYNIHGYYEPLREVFRQMIRCGFLEDADLAQYEFVSGIEELSEALS